MKKILFRKLLIDYLSFFLITLLGSSIVVWVFQAVNYLDIMIEDGRDYTIYINYSLLNFPKILSKLFTSTGNVIWTTDHSEVGNFNKRDLIAIKKQLYFSAIKSFDTELGQVLDLMKDLNQYDNIVFLNYHLTYFNLSAQCNNLVNVLFTPRMIIAFFFELVCALIKFAIFL